MQAIEDARRARPDRELMERSRDAYLDFDRADLALEAQRRLAESRPGDIEVQLICGDVALAAHQPQAAMDAFNRVLVLDNTNGVAAARLKDLEAGRPPQLESRGFTTPAHIRSLRLQIKENPEFRMELLRAQASIGQVLFEKLPSMTEDIIAASDYYWYDESYYASLGRIPGLMTRKKRPVRTIALSYWRLHDGGTERVTSRLATIWKSLGYRVILLTEQPPTERDYSCDAAVERHVLPPHRQRFATRGKALAELLRREKVDVFVSNLWVETATSWDLFVAKSLGIPVIIGWHNVFDAGIYNGHDIHFFKKRLAAYKYADLVVALSLMDQYWFSTQKISSRLIHNPLTFERMPYDVSALDSKTIVWVGRVEQHQKRIEHVLRMFALVLKNVPDAVLVVVGDGPDRDWAERLAKDLEIDERVRFVGYSAKVEEFIRDAAVHVMTSEFEGAPMVIGEIWSHGVPTVMYDLSYVEFLREGKGFISVDQLDYTALAEKVSLVLQDDELRNRMGREALATAQAFFDIDVGAEWKAVFDDLGSKDDMSTDLSPDAVASVAPILTGHLVERMYAVDARAARDLEAARRAPAQGREGGRKRGGRRASIGAQIKSMVRGIPQKAMALAAAAIDRRPAIGFAKLRTIDFAHIGLGDNLMAWVGLHTLLCNDFAIIAPGCKLYVPNGLARLATHIFSPYGLQVVGVAPHTVVPHVSPVFSPLPPESATEWYKTYIGVDWRMNCFEALDAQKTIPRLHSANDGRTRFRLGLSERLLYGRRGWQAATADYIGYRMWLPVAQKLGVLPLIFLSMMKRSLAALRAEVSRYVDQLGAAPDDALDLAVFPAGKSFQAIPPTACKILQEKLPIDRTHFYIQSDDPWLMQYYAAGISPRNLGSIDALFQTIKSARRVLTTDSFTSHVAQLLRDDFVLVLSRDFRENIVHPGANPMIVANHPPCAPCNYHPRAEAGECLAQRPTCAAFDSRRFIDDMAKAMLAFEPVVGRMRPDSDQASTAGVRESQGALPAS